MYKTRIFQHKKERVNLILRDFMFPGAKRILGNTLTLNVI